MQKTFLRKTECQWEIRRALPTEAEFLSGLAMRSKAHWPYPQDYLAKCEAALTLSPEDITSWPVFVAERDSVPIGFFALKSVAGEDRLDHLWIAPEFIGQGIGSQLLSQALEEAQKLGWSKFRLAADPYALEFYRRHGGVQIGVVQSRIKPDLFLPHVEFQTRTDADDSKRHR